MKQLIDEVATRDFIQLLPDYDDVLEMVSNNKDYERAMTIQVKAMKINQELEQVTEMESLVTQL